MSLPRILDKLRHYDLWSRSDAGKKYLTDLHRQHGAQHPRPNFRLLIVCHDKAGLHRDGDERRLLDMLTQALELPTKMQERVWLTTVERLRANQALPSPLDTPLFIRARDARPFLFEYRSHLAASPKRRGQKRYHHQRRFWAERIPDFPLHSLFPQPG
jgi:hypothetical protein